MNSVDSIITLKDIDIEFFEKHMISILNDYCNVYLVEKSYTTDDICKLNITFKSTMKKTQLILENIDGCWNKYFAPF